MLSRFVKSQNGMTLVEVLLAAVLLVGVSAIGFQVILSAQQTQATVAQRVSEEIDLSQGLLELRAELSSSYVMRSGQLNCGEIGKLVRTNRSVQNFELMDQGKANFSFYYSTFSAVASRDLRHANNVFVTDAARFNAGQVVLMMGAQNANVSGFYKIQSKEVVKGKVTGRLALEPVDMSANPTECKSSGPAMPLDELFQKASVFLIHEVSFVTYRFRPARDQVADDNGRPLQTYDLFKSYWPAAGAAAAVPARLSIPRVTSLKINPSWVEYGQLGQEYNSRSGRWTAAVGLRSYRKTLYGNNNRQIRFSPYQAGIRALYELPSSRPLNPVAQVGAE